MMRPAEEPILRTDNVVKTFGGVHALDGCTLEVRRGSITGLIGPNGAGKSTLLNVVVGLLSPDDGGIYFEGERVDGLPPHELVQKGIIKTFQIPRELRNLTVLENVLLAARGVPEESLTRLILVPVWLVVSTILRFALPYFGRLLARALVVVRRWTWAALKDNERKTQRRAEDILRFVGLYGLRNEYAKNLSGGQKKLLELTRALMSDPSLMLLDEPVAGVNPVLAAKILDLIGQLRNQGKTVFLIEHDMDVVMNRCDWIIVLHQGRKLAEGLPADIKRDQRVVEAYLGA